MADSIEIGAAGDAATAHGPSRVGAARVGSALAQRGASSALFIAIAGLLILAGFAGFDRWFYETISVRINTPGNDFDLDFYRSTWVVWDAARLFSHAVGVSAAVVVVLFVHRRGWRAATELMLLVLAAALLANILQSVLGRARPNLSEHALEFSPGWAGLLFRDARSGFGFPSGEAATASAMAAVLARLFPRASVVVWSLAGAACLARWLPGMHYFSDVVAGALIGAVIGRRAMPRSDVRRITAALAAPLGSTSA